MYVLTPGILRECSQLVHPHSYALYKYIRWITTVAISFPPQSQHSGFIKPLKKHRGIGADAWKLHLGTMQPKERYW